MDHNHNNQACHKNFLNMCSVFGYLALVGLLVLLARLAYLWPVSNSGLVALCFVFQGLVMCMNILSNNFKKAEALFSSEHAAQISEELRKSFLTNSRVSIYWLWFVIVGVYLILPIVWGSSEKSGS